MKLGIVGSGMIVKDFLKMFNELNGIELLGISARNEENLKNLCVQYPIERYYLSYEEMLENKDIDTIYVAVPNDLHFIMSKKRFSQVKTLYVKNHSRLTSKRL